jgi:hypothetical protein
MFILLTLENESRTSHVRSLVHTDTIESFSEDPDDNNRVVVSINGEDFFVKEEMDYLVGKLSL